MVVVNWGSPSGETGGSTGALKNQQLQNISGVKEVFLYLANYFHHSIVCYLILFYDFQGGA